MQFIRSLGCGFQSDVNLAPAWELNPAENHDTIYACNACHLEWDTGDLRSSKHEFLVLALWCQISLGGLRVACFCRLCIERAPQHTLISRVLHISDGIPMCHTLYAEVFSALLCSELYEGMQVLAHGRMCEYKWSLCFQKWSIVLGISGKLDHPVIACNCITCEYTKYSTSSGMGLCFLRWWLWRGLSFFLFTLLSQLEMFKTRRCFSRSYDPIS